MTNLVAIKCTTNGRVRLADFTTNETREYTIYTRSNNNARTINTPMMARTYYDKTVVKGYTELANTVAELQSNGAKVTEISGWNVIVFGF